MTGHSHNDATIIMAPMWHIREPWTAPAYISQALRSHGHKVQFLDYNIQLYRVCEPLGYGHLWHEGNFFEEWIQGSMDYLVHVFDLDEIQGEVIGISLTYTSVSFGIALARAIRERFPHRTIVLGGHPFFLQQNVASIPLDVADVLCKGEGEHTICEIMARVGAPLEQIPGLYIPAEGKWQLTSERSREENLDRLAWPRFEGIDLGRYGEHMLPLMGSRGCIGRCLFCTDRYHSPGYRTRSAMNQVDELEYLSQQFSVKHFPYNDPLLNGDFSVLFSKTKEILRRGLNISYGGNMMIRKDMPEELFPLLRKSGMSVALIGAESGSATTLKNMRKRHTPEIAERFIRNCHNAGIKTELNFIVGYPTETESHFQETCDFLVRNREYIDSVISMMPLLLPPSDLRDRGNQFKIVLDDPDEFSQWHVDGGSNTLEIRINRVDRILSLCQELGLVKGYVMLNGMTLEKKPVPIAPDFLKAYAEYWLGREERSEAERHSASAAAERLQAYIRKYYTLNLAQSVQKVVSNLRQRGVRKTIARGKDWIKLKRG